MARRVRVQRPAADGDDSQLARRRDRTMQDATTKALTSLGVSREALRTTLPKKGWEGERAYLVSQGFEDEHGDAKSIIIQPKGTGRQRVHNIPDTYLFYNLVLKEAYLIGYRCIQISMAELYQNCIQNERQGLPLDEILQDAELVFIKDFYTPSDNDVTNHINPINDNLIRNTIEQEIIRHLEQKNITYVLLCSHDFHEAAAWYSNYFLYALEISSDSFTISSRRG